MSLPQSLKILTRKTVAAAAVVASLGTLTLAGVQPAEAHWHHAGWHHGGAWHHGGGWHHGRGWHHGWGWHRGWAGPRFYHHGWGYRPIGFHHGYHPCLRRVWGPYGSHLVRAC